MASTNGGCSAVNLNLMQILQGAAFLCLSSIMRIKAINGQESYLDAGISVSEMLEALDIEANKVIIEINLEIIEKDKYSNKLHEDDKVKSLHSWRRLNERVFYPKKKARYPARKNAAQL